MAFVGLASRSSTRSLYRFARGLSTDARPSPSVVPKIQDTTEIQDESGAVSKERIARTAPIKVFVLLF